MLSLRASLLGRKTLLLSLFLGLLGTCAGLIFSTFSSLQSTDKTKRIGEERLVAWETLPEMDGAACEWVPASAATSLVAALQDGRREESAPPRPNEEARAGLSRRGPVYTIKDPHFAFAGIAVDPIRNEVVIAEENVSSVLVYDRMTHTPPNAVMSEPKRVIGGENTFLEYACSVYIDPASGDIYGVNNDTMSWMPVFGRDASGNVAPKRKLETPHTTFGIVADEEAQELFFTIQDDHAIVVFKKDAKDEDSPVRILQGSQTQMADPHGIALDTKTGLIFVSNWGTSNERPALSEGGGGGNVNRPDFPVGRARAYLGSGKIAPPSITVYDKKAQGDTPPVRVIQGPRTQMDWPTALAIHPERGEIFVANDTADSVLVFRTDASGDAAPIRVIKGPRTMVKNPTGVAIDLKNNELWVANFGSHSATVFDIDAGGDVAPKRVIRSGPIDAPSPNLSNPHTVAYDSKREEILVAN
jgi:DNA-binding beta-propeller fold protein YncE